MNSATAKAAPYPEPVIIQPGTEHELLEELHKEESTSTTYGIDCETVGIDPRKTAAGGARDARIVCWSLARRDRWDRYWRYFLWADSLAAFSDWLTHAPLVGHNIFGFDWHMFSNHGVVLRNIVGDTLDVYRRLNNGRTKQHGLKVLLKNVLGVEQPGYAELFSRRKFLGERTYKRITSSYRNGINLCTGGVVSRLGAMELIPLDELAADYPQRLTTLYDYATLDAWGTLKLYEHAARVVDKTISSPVRDRAARAAL